MALSCGRGFGSLISSIPEERLDASLTLRSRKLVRENRAHQLSLRRMAWDVVVGLDPMMDDGGWPGKREYPTEAEDVWLEEEL